MDKNTKPLLSLCIPTNGIVEWVIPVIDSIYYQKYDDEKFEVIITDNGNGSDLENALNKYFKKHNNLIYKKTNAILFQNQIECFKLASGDLIKLINHRYLLSDNAINTFIEYVKKYKNEKPLIYFFNNNSKDVKNDVILDFDGFMNNLGYFSSWSGGISYWRSDFNQIFNKNKFDKYFPHLDILLAFKNKKKYVINNDQLMNERVWDASKKGKYDFFDAFLVHYLDVMHELYKNKYISNVTYDKIKKQNLRFNIWIHFEYVVRKLKCSYILTNFWSCFKKYYNVFDFLYEYLILIIKLPIRIIIKINKIIFGKLVSLND